MIDRSPPARACPGRSASASLRYRHERNGRGPAHRPESAAHIGRSSDSLGQGGTGPPYPRNPGQALPARTAGYRRTGCMSITGAAVVKRRSITGRFWGAPARADAAGCTSITGAADAERARTGAPAGICGAIAAGQAIHWGRRGLEQLKGLLSHVDPHLTLGQIVGRVVREAVERHDPTRPGRRTGIRADAAPPKLRRRRKQEGQTPRRRNGTPLSCWRTWTTNTPALRQQSSGPAQ